MSFRRKFIHFGGILLNKILPEQMYGNLVKFKIKIFGRPYIPGETSKAKNRRLKEGFFKKFTKGNGLDIGFGGDIICKNARGYDFEHGDAQNLDGLENKKFDFVYSSHTLEHMKNPRIALKNWWDKVKKGGYLIIYVPHRDLFEKKKRLPSKWNKGHFGFFMPDKHESPNTLGVRQLLNKTLDKFNIIYIKVCAEGYKCFGEDKPEGEYSIEAVIKKL